MPRNPTEALPEPELEVGAEPEPMATALEPEPEQAPPKALNDMSIDELCEVLRESNQLAAEAQEFLVYQKRVLLGVQQAVTQANNEFHEAQRRVRNILSRLSQLSEESARAAQDPVSVPLTEDGFAPS